MKPDRDEADERSEAFYAEIYARLDVLAEVDRNPCFGDDGQVLLTAEEIRFVARALRTRLDEFRGVVDERNLLRSVLGKIECACFDKATEGKVTQ